MRRYETIFIIRPDQGESQIKDTIKRFEGIVTQGGGEIAEIEEWGSRELAYRISGEHRGYYVRFDYVSEGAVMNEVERNLKLSDAVLRYLSVLLDSDANPDNPNQALKAWWPSADAYRRFVEVEAKISHPATLNVLREIKDPEIRATESIMFARSLVGLPLKRFMVQEKRKDTNLTFMTDISN